MPSENVELCTSKYLLYTLGPTPLWTLISILSLHLNHTTLLGSGSEWPKDEALLLTMVSYVEKINKVKI